MELIRLDTELCRADGICVSVCPIGCLAADADGRPVAALPDVCMGCGQCVAVCPHGALDNVRAPMSGCLPAPRELPEPKILDNLMHARRSVRAYRPEALPRETLQALLDVARYAPTARNTQQISYIVTATPEATQALSQAIGQWMAPLPGMERYARLLHSGHDFVTRGAPHLILALADAASDWGLTDAAIALSYLELAAAARGLGVCWAGIVQRALALNPDLAAQAGVPEGRKVCGALMLGKPRLKYALVPPRNEAKVVWR